MSFNASGPLVYVPPCGALLPEAQARVLARQACIAVGGPVTGPEGLLSDAPVWELVQSGYGLCRVAYYYEFVKEDPPGTVLDAVFVIVDGVTGEIWRTGPVLAGSKTRLKTLKSAANDRFALAARLTGIPRAKRWGMELAAGRPIKGGQPDAGVRRWSVAAGKSRIELARSDRNRTLWARSPGSGWTGVSLTRTQETKIQALSAGTPSDRLYRNPIWKGMITTPRG